MRLEARSLALALAAVACAIAAIVAAACIVIPPPDVPNPLLPPRILHQSVVPPPGVPIADWPSEFVVPVEVDSRVNLFEYQVFVTPGQSNNGFDHQTPVPVSPSTLDAGMMALIVTVDPRPYDLGICHQIEVMVALSFPAQHSADVNGSDSVFWTYEGSGAPYGCPLYDAGLYQDGFVPPSEASDTLPAIPTEAGVDP